MSSNVRPFWPPLTAGIALGLVLLATFLLTGHGLGASGFFARFTAWLGGEIARPATQANSYLGPFLKGAAGPLASWISWEIVGVHARRACSPHSPAAGFASGSMAQQISASSGRMALALGGGVLTGFGARLARGCTSGIGLSGGATLAVAAFLFLIALLHRRHRGQLDGAEGLGMSLPLYDGGVASGLLSGMLFGYVLENAGFGSPRKLTAQFRFSDWSVFKVMFTAIIVAAIGLYAADEFGLSAAERRLRSDHVLLGDLDRRRAGRRRHGDRRLLPRHVVGRAGDRPARRLVFHRRHGARRRRCSPACSTRSKASTKPPPDRRRRPWARCSAFPPGPCSAF